METLKNVDELCAAHHYDAKKLADLANLDEQRRAGQSSKAAGRRAPMSATRSPASSG